MSDPRHTARARYRRGLTTSAINNASAFGFSVMITSAFGMLSHFKGTPTTSEVFLFALAAVAGVSIIDAVASGGFRRRPHIHPSEVVMLGTAANLISVAIALAFVYGTGRLLPEPYAWAIAPMLAATIYVLVEGAELAIAENVQQRVLHDPDPESND